MWGANKLITWVFKPYFKSLQIQKIRWSCGNKNDLGIYEEEGWRDWSERETTPDQKRIESFLSSKPHGGKFLLHVGVGNSEFAKSVHSDFVGIDGITIERNEYEKGHKSGIDNYQVFLINKFSSKLSDNLGSNYDLIIDNNPASFACCRKHFFIMMMSYWKLLRPGGVLLTDREGLEWVSSLNNPLWEMTGKDWLEIGSKFKFEGVSYDEWVIGLRKPIKGQKT